MTLKQLRYIVMVAEVGNITEAAKKLYISQPSLTHAIHLLENELGIILFARNKHGISVTPEGTRFLRYARQILEQVSMVEEQYLHTEMQAPKFSVSCQHYAFAVNAFVDLIRQYNVEEYDFTILETSTYDVIHDVSTLRSEVGILFMNDANKKYIEKLLNQNNLRFTELFVAKPHVFISKKHPLIHKKVLTLKDLEPYPCFTFDQGEHDAFYLWEEILPAMKHKKEIHVHDRASLFNLAVGLNGYTISSGVLGADLNGEHVVVKPLAVDDYMRIGTIMRKDVVPSRYAKAYLETLQKYIKEYKEKNMSKKD
ncbi:MAG: LysR family transcriptional regulator [Acidaminococcus sp.]|nr:LysR family transcriptional regulator [Acidaminococcus sp.]MCI2100072.1 LysR family transcriptional regulator [Acidaminococcus sp.]MCI2114330.1 LysR family transcriptional regulator [Acidaminococcus sp.]MCI2116283.1 LysR family transcriptional regulator [Acidaminococcus sp.]